MTDALMMVPFRLIPTSLGDAMELAKLISGSELCPKAYRGRPQDCILAYEYGSALGFSWMQSLKAVAVINGTAAIYGDAVPALILGSGLCERFHETFAGQPFDDAYKAICTIKRKGLADETVRTFSVADAKRANLWGKQGPWTQYTGRMLTMRARGFAARDSFADKLSGLILAEEAEDYPTTNGEPAAPIVTGEVLLSRLSEALQTQIGKAFELLHLAPGLRLAKLNEWLGTGAGTDDEKAERLLDWCRTEFANRQGKTRAPKTGNGKTPVEPVEAAVSAPPKAEEMFKDTTSDVGF